MKHTHKGVTAELRWPKVYIKPDPGSRKTAIGTLYHDEQRAGYRVDTTATTKTLSGGFCRNLFQAMEVAIEDYLSTRR